MPLSFEQNCGVALALPIVHRSAAREKPEANASPGLVWGPRTVGKWRSVKRHALCRGIEVGERWEEGKTERGAEQRVDQAIEIQTSRIMPASVTFDIIIITQLRCSSKMHSSALIIVMYAEKHVPPKFRCRLRHAKARWDEKQTKRQRCLD